MNRVGVQARVLPRCWNVIPMCMERSRRGGYLYLAFIGLALAILGGAFVVILGRGYLKARETRNWAVEQGTVIQSKIGERTLGPGVPTEYTHDLLFEYGYEGKTYQGDRVKRRENPYFKNKAKAQRWVDDWPTGKKVEVFVNPEEPSFAVLDHDTKAAGYTIWFPGLFLVGGLVLLIRALIKLFTKDKKF